jgi:putative transposase
MSHPSGTMLGDDSSDADEQGRCGRSHHPRDRGDVGSVAVARAVAALLCRVDACRVQALEQVKANLEVRAAQRKQGVAENDLTPALGWSRESLTSAWRAARDEAHPWHTDVSIHAFRTGLDNAAQALGNFSKSRTGKRRGRKVGFPRFKNRHSRQAVTFVELNVDHHHWINPDSRTHVRLMLPRKATGGTWERRHTRPRAEQAAGRDRRSELAWLHTHQPDAVAEVWALCEDGCARVQALTIKHEGGRWKAVFRLRMLDGSPRLRNPGAPVKQHGGAIGVDLGLTHLVTLDRPVPGLTDEHGHVPNPRVLDQHLTRLRRIDRAIARSVKGSKNRTKLLRRRARLHGRIAATRKLYVHEVSRRLAGGFDVVCVEDLNVSGMAARKGLRNGRSVAEASMGALLRQLDYKTNARGTRMVRVGRFYPSSQTCSQCGARAKLPLWQRAYHCTTCGLTLDRDVNAARNIRAEGERLLREQQDQQDVPDVASIREETQNGEPRPDETEPALPKGSAGGRGSFEAATDPVTPALAGVT